MNISTSKECDLSLMILPPNDLAQPSREADITYNELLCGDAATKEKT